MARVSSIGGATPSRATGFRPRTISGLHNGLAAPAELMMSGFHLWSETRWPPRNCASAACAVNRLSERSRLGRTPKSTRPARHLRGNDDRINSG